MNSYILKFKLISIMCLLLFACEEDDAITIPTPETGEFPSKISISNLNNSTDARTYDFRYDNQNRLIEIKFNTTNGDPIEDEGLVNIFYNNSGQLHYIQVSSNTGAVTDFLIAYDGSEHITQVTLDELSTPGQETIDFSYNNGQNSYTASNGVTYDFDANDNLEVRTDDFYTINFNGQNSNSNLFNYQTYRSTLCIWFDTFFPFGGDINALDLLTFTSDIPTSVVAPDQTLSFENALLSAEGKLIEVDAVYPQGQIIAVPSQKFVISYEEREL